MEEQHEGTRYDIIILGASGFTGKYVIREALKFLNVPSSPLKSLALVGRNPSKVSEALEWASHPNPPPQIPILTADITDPSSLRRVASQAKIILNCAGPFNLYGEPVVAACIDAGCDYLDITGEVEFAERIEAYYQDKAAASNSLVVCACGYDAVASELGMIFNSRQWVSPAAPNRVDAYLSFESNKNIVFNQASFDSFVHEVANEDKLQRLRRSKPTSRPHPVIPGPPPKGAILEYKKEIGVWAVVFPLLEVPMVERTLGFLTENPKGAPGVNESAQQIEKRQKFWSTVKPAHFSTNWTSKSFLGVIRYIIIGTLIWLLGRFCIGRWLLMRFRTVFSLGLFRNGGPTEEEVDSASFKLWFIGHGYSDASLASKGNMKSDMKIITRITGPDVGYVATPIILVQSALVLLNQRHDLPKSGVFTAGTLFGHTDLQQRLQQNGISFDFISKETFPNKI